MFHLKGISPSTETKTSPYVTNEQTNDNTLSKPQSDVTSVKLEPYSNNTLMTVDSENADSRLISFKDGFNFEENYQEWSTNVSYTFYNNLIKIYYVV